MEFGFMVLGAGFAPFCGICRFACGLEFSVGLI